MKRRRIVLALAALCAACALLPMCLPPPDGCVPTATRCSGQQAQVCDGANRWTVTQDCDQIAAQSGGAWACCALASDAGVALDGGPGPDHVCVPSNQCVGGAS